MHQPGKATKIPTHLLHPPRGAWRKDTASSWLLLFRATDLHKIRPRSAGSLLTPCYLLLPAGGELQKHVVSHVQSKLRVAYAYIMLCPQWSQSVSGSKISCSLEAGFAPLTKPESRRSTVQHASTKSFILRFQFPDSMCACARVHPDSMIAGC